MFISNLGAGELLEVDQDGHLVRRIDVQASIGHEVIRDRFPRPMFLSSMTN